MKDSNFLLIIAEAKLDIMTMKEPQLNYLVFSSTYILDFETLNESAEDRLKIAIVLTAFLFFSFNQIVCLLELIDLNWWVLSIFAMHNLI